MNTLEIATIKADRDVNGHSIRFLADKYARDPNTILHAINTSISDVNSPLRYLYDKQKERIIYKLKHIAEAIVNSISESDLAKANLLQKATTMAIMHDKTALLQGQPTVIVEHIRTLPADELDAKIKELAIEAQITEIKPVDK